MKTSYCMRARVLPTVIALSLAILVAMLGIIALWEQENRKVLRAVYRRTCLANLESAYTLYCNAPHATDTIKGNTVRLYDSVPYGDTHICVKPWGLYDAVFLSTPDSMFRQCRLTGARANGATLYYADNGSVLTVSGRCELQGALRLPRNGLRYGRMRDKVYCGSVIPQTRIGISDEKMPAIRQSATENIRRLLELGDDDEYTPIPDSVRVSFVRDSTLRLRLGSATVSNCRLYGNIRLDADELHIDSTCRMENVVICARNVSIADGTKVSVQIFARDTVVIGKRCNLEYPSGIYAESYAELGDCSTVNGYAIVRASPSEKRISPSYKQSVTARVRGLLWVEGRAQLQGIVSGRTVLERAYIYTPHGYYKDMVCDASVLENDITAQPQWMEADTLGKEVVWLY